MSMSMHTIAHEAAEGNVISDPSILGGTPIFRGTRVPVSTFFEYLLPRISRGVV